MPRSRASVRSSQSALRAQVWQLPSCSERSSSTTVWRPLRAQRRVGLDDHALGDRGRARGHERLGALDFDQADAAGADRLHVFEVAEARDLRAGLAGGLQDGRAVRDLDLDVVYSEGWHQRFTSVSAQRLSVVAAQAAPRLGDGHLGRPRELDLVEAADAHVGGHDRHARRAGVSTGSASGSNAVSTATSRRQKAWLAPVRCSSIADGGLLAGADGGHDRRRTGDGVAAGEDPVDRGAAVLVGRRASPCGWSRRSTPSNSDGAVEPLADGGDDLVALDHEVGVAAGHRTATAARVVVAEGHRPAASRRAACRCGVVDDLDRRDERLQDRCPPPRRRRSPRPTPASGRACGGRGS